MTRRYSLSACNALRAHLNEQHAQGMTWKKVGAENSISGPMAFRIAQRGYVPRSLALRRQLGLMPPRPSARERRVALALELLGSLHGH